MQSLTTTWAEQDLIQHEREQEEWLRSRPVCDKCGEPIQEDDYYERWPGDCLCEDCFEQWVKDYIRRTIE